MNIVDDGSCNVIDRHVLKDWGACTHKDLCKFTWTVVLLTVDIVDHDVMNAVALPIEWSAVVGQGVGDL